MLLQRFLPLRQEVLDHDCECFKLGITTGEKLLEVQDKSTLIFTFCLVLSQLKGPFSGQHIWSCLGLDAQASGVFLPAFFNCVENDSVFPEPRRKPEVSKQSLGG